LPGDSGVKVTHLLGEHGVLVVGDGGGGVTESNVGGEAAPDLGLCDFVLRSTSDAMLCHQ
jgi:hypothetical protein